MHIESIVADVSMDTCSESLNMCGQLVSNDLSYLIYADERNQTQNVCLSANLLQKLDRQISRLCANALDRSTGDNLATARDNSLQFTNNRRMEMHLIYWERKGRSSMEENVTHHNIMNRRNIYISICTALLALAGISFWSGTADATISIVNATIPPPGGTLPSNQTGIRILHLAPFDNTDTDIAATINAGNVSAQFPNIQMGKSSGGYLAVDFGPVNLAINPNIGGGPLNFAVNLNPNTNYTAALIGGANGWPIEVLNLVDTTSKPAALKGKVRIVHAAPFGTMPSGGALPVNTQISVMTDGGASISNSFEGLLYEESTPYVSLPVGAHDWKVTLPGEVLFIDLPEFTLYSGAVLTIYIVGDGTVQQGAGLLVIQETGDVPTILNLPIIFPQG